MRRRENSSNDAEGGPAVRAVSSTAMKVAEYERHLREEFCWVCHGATHHSHAQQRQCAVCRRKWSYVRRRLEWNLVRAFCMMDTPYRAAKDLKIAYRTAWTHFMEFERTVRQSGSMWAGVFCLDLPKRKMPTEEVRQKTAVVIYRERIAPGLTRLIQYVGRDEGER